MLFNFFETGVAALKKTVLDDEIKNQDMKTDVINSSMGGTAIC